MANEAVVLEGVSFGYGRELAIRDVSLAIPPGTFVTFLGPSGCGKTTLLKLLAGYLLPQKGRIVIAGKDVSTLPPDRRNVGMVFQNYALFPHLTARQNVAFGPEVRGASKVTVCERVESALATVGLGTAERERRPSQLSGGQQQRVALARALACQPPLLLLDEPLASLDRQLREEVREELRGIHARSNCVTIMVTHDQAEALGVSDLIGVIRGGRLLQLGSPRELYEQPRTPFIARSLGETNLIDGKCLGLSSQKTYLIRPDRVRIGSGNWECQVKSLSFQGPNQVVELEGSGFFIRSRCQADLKLAVGEKTRIDLPRELLWEIPESDEPL